MKDIPITLLTVSIHRPALVGMIDSIEQRVIVRASLKTNYQYGWRVDDKPGFEARVTFSARPDTGLTKHVEFDIKNNAGILQTLCAGRVATASVIDAVIIELLNNLK